MPFEALKVHGDTLVAPVEFRITGTRGLDLAAHWIVNSTATCSCRGWSCWHEATRPVDSDADVFKSTH